MKRILLKSSILIVFISILFSCHKYPCINLPEYNKSFNKTKEWFVNDSIKNTNFTNQNNISQTLTKSKNQITTYEAQVTDDCDNQFASFSYSTSYRTSISIKNIHVDVYASALEEFHMKIMCGIPGNEKSITYYFTSQKTEGENVSVNKINAITVNGKQYLNVLEFNFGNNSITTIYYVRNYGIIKFKTKNGENFELN